MAGKQLKLYVSFKEKEKYLLDHVKNKRDYSAYIKDLIEADMKKEVGNGPKQYVNAPIGNNNLDFDF